MSRLWDRLPDMKRIPVKSLGKSLSATLKSVSASGPPVLVTNNNLPSVVLVSVEHFEELVTLAQRCNDSDRAAWWCSSCHRPVELGEESTHSLCPGKDPDAEPLCWSCGSVLDVNL